MMLSPQICRNDRDEGVSYYLCVCVFVAAQFVQSANMSTPGEQKQEFVLEVDVDV